MRQPVLILIVDGYFATSVPCRAGGSDGCSKSLCCEPSCVSTSCVGFGVNKSNISSRCPGQQCTQDECCDRTCISQTCPPGMMVLDVHALCEANAPGNCTDKCCVTVTTTTYTTHTLTTTTGCQSHEHCQGTVASIGGQMVATSICDRESGMGTCIPKWK